VRGRVLSFTPVDGSGLISGEDGQRYPFVRAGLGAGVIYLAVGSEVDFQAENGVASGIYVISTWLGDRNRIIAAILALFLGHWGVHKFYLGKTNAGVIMLICGTVGWFLLLPGIAVWVIAIAEAVIYLVKTDQDFYRDYVVGGRSWL
jgi:TM2 domain-containing membrane protein YozV